MKDRLVDELIGKILKLPGIISSMQKDVKAKNPLEIDVILGVPVRKARELGVPIPVLEVIYALVAGLLIRLLAKIAEYTAFVLVHSTNVPSVIWERLPKRT
jgi:ketopantoate reductase